MAYACTKSEKVKDNDLRQEEYVLEYMQQLYLTEREISENNSLFIQQKYLCIKQSLPFLQKWEKRN